MLSLKRSPEYFFDILVYGLSMSVLGAVIYFYSLNIPGFDIAIQETRLGFLALLGLLLTSLGVVTVVISGIFWYLAKRQSGSP